MDNEQSINETLKRFYGTNLSGLPLFRVSFSDKQTEIRKREYNEFSSSGLIFLGTRRTTSECKKYPTIKAKWILEKWIPPDSSYTDEIVSAKEKGSYECIYIFQDKNGWYLPLNLEVAKIIIIENLYPGRIGKLTEDSELDQFKEEEKERISVENAVAAEYEKLKSKTANNRYLDGFQIAPKGGFRER